jgi:hypothetical protein
MLSCPRCLRPVPPDATRCPSCGYDLPAAVRAAPHAAPASVAEVPPGAPLTRSGEATTATPSDETPGIAPVADDNDSSLIPGLTEAPPHLTGPSEQQRRHRWQVGGAVVAALAVLAVIAVLAASRIGHRGTAHARPVITAALPPTSGISPSSATSASASASGSGSGSRSGSTRAADRRGLAQASIIAGYLTTSGRARPGIGAALSAISDCTNIASAVTTLHNAANIRTRILTALTSLDVSALPNGAAAVADLGRAMRASADADGHYAAWGQAVAGCHGHAPHNAEFAAALQSGTVADAAKQRFADEWNPIAATYGLPKQNANTI